jgi:hypothetical protein
MQLRIPISRLMSVALGASPDGLPSALGAKRLDAHDVAILRQQMLEHCPPIEDPELLHFFEQVLAKDEVVESYFCPKVRRQVPGVIYYAPAVQIPFAEASRAAGRAYKSTLLEPRERSLAYVAAMLFSCGMFHSQHPVFRPKGRNFNPGRVYWRKVGQMLLESGLLDLRDRNRTLGEVMTVVLGFAGDGHCDPQQAARIGTAVYLTNLRVTALWTRP